MKSSNITQDITTAIFFLSGIIGFMSGEFVISTTLFGAASLLSNLNLSTPVKV